jgi:hypothetical protein
VPQLAIRKITLLMWAVLIGVAAGGCDVRSHGDSGTTWDSQSDFASAALSGVTANTDGTVMLQGRLVDRLTPRAKAMGPLRRLASNPRYFSADGVTPVYLTGSHTWVNLVDGSPRDPPAPFDYDGYLADLKRWHHNFIRLWAWDVTVDSNRGERYFYAPQPFVRSGPGLALDGKPKFDLSRFNQAYFSRLRSRVAHARAAGIYVGVMLFEGYTPDKGPLPDAYRGHPFARENNINGIDGDVNDDGLVNEVYRLPAQGGLRNVNDIQKAYVRKVIDALNDLDNVLYEVANEAPPATTEWQYELIDFVRAYEARKLEQHPVGMTFQYEGGENKTLDLSTADWISPSGPVDRPSVATGAKVVLSDTDHLCGLCIEGDDDWAWREFTSGRNPIYMDAYDDPHHRSFAKSGARARAAMGHTRRYARRTDLAQMTPRPDLSSTGYVLADPGREYLVYQPESAAPFALDLSLRTPKGFDLEWFSLASRRKVRSTISGRAKVTLRAPFEGGAVAYLRAYSSYRSSGTLVATHDAGEVRRWKKVSLEATIPARTQIVVEARSSDDKTGWSPWRRSVTAVPAARYVQLRITFSTTTRSRTPVLDKVTLH